MITSAKTQRINKEGNWLFFAAMVLAQTLLAGCDRSERIPTTQERLKTVQQQQSEGAEVAVRRKSIDYLSDIKSIKDNEPAAPSKPVPTKPEPEPIAVAKPVDTKAAAQSPTPATTSTPTVAPPSAPVQVPTPQPPPVAAAPRPAPASPEPILSATVISKVAPEFPKEARQQRVESGHVKAKMLINAKGEVTEVTILQATPVRIFNAAVKNALLQWKFNPGSDGRTAETEIDFKQ